MPHIALIAAVDARNGLGRGGTMAWHIPAELALFRKLTDGCPVIVGYTTYLSLPRVRRGLDPLPGRRVIVLSRQARTLHRDTLAARSIDDALAQAARLTASTTWIAGGASVYRETIGLADEIRLSQVSGDHDADVHFPPILDADWQQIAEEIVPSSTPFRALTFARKRQS